jgi:protein-L-isoaspartate O-methyltransferase
LLTIVTTQNESDNAANCTISSRLASSVKVIGWCHIHFDQLKTGGNLVIPIGNALLGQTLRVVHKEMNGQINSRNALPVIFVPMTGPH